MLYNKETYKLKEYFNNLLGYNLYDLFPKIKENLQRYYYIKIKNERSEKIGK